MASRRKIRECALQMMFQWDIGRDSPDMVLELFWSNNRPQKDDLLRDAANSLFQGTVGAVEEIDRRIRSTAEHWRPERMAAVDRNVLRLGTYELLYRRETPPPVVINEALEIARKFSGEDSVQFINGLLDHIRKEVETSPAA
jgi:N utilization substance protein B